MPNLTTVKTFDMSREFNERGSFMPKLNPVFKKINLLISQPKKTLSLYAVKSENNIFFQIQKLILD